MVNRADKKTVARRSWYRVTLTLILLVPAVFCQTVYPLVAPSAWEDLSESIYAQLLFWQEPKSTQPSRVAIIEIDDKTLANYGWPIDRPYFVKLLARLKSSGHPWLLSMLQFQSLESVKNTASSRQERADKDKGLAKAIRTYGRYIGSGLSIEAGAELSAYQEENLLPRIILSRSGKTPESLPYLPLRLNESERFVEAQKTFGIGTLFGTQAVIHCAQLYTTDINQPGNLLIPSALAWTAAYATEARIHTTHNANWPRPGDKSALTWKRRLNIAYQHCLTSPGLTTRDFMRHRQIERWSLVDILESKQRIDLRDKVIILARSDMRKFRGPGIGKGEGDDEARIIPEHILAARFLDGLLTGETVRRETTSRKSSLNWLPVAVASGLLLASLAISPAALSVLSLFLLSGTLLHSSINLQSGLYFIPITTLAYLAFSCVGSALFFAYKRYDSIRRQIRFAVRLRENLGSCNTLTTLEERARATCELEFSTIQLAFTGYDQHLYRTSDDPATALAWLDEQSNRKLAHAPTPLPGSLAEQQLPRQKRHLLASITPLGEQEYSERIPIDSELGHLGILLIAVRHPGYDQAFVCSIVDSLRTELVQHWHRIKLLTDQKLLDYRYLMEQTRGSIMERFLTHVLVAKFSDKKTMLENLNSVLRPRATKAALMQADIRGYSKVSAKLSPMDMVGVLQAYFRNVVDAAQKVAQVKLIGDCIFLFIEEAAGSPDCSPADLALELAQLLVAETNKQNALRSAQNEEPLYFGIGIHYGEVVVGNLSSDSCIDYTVIGPNVNFVARLEELTKTASIHDILGINGTLLSIEAQTALVKYRAKSFVGIDLESAQASIRSFPQVKRVLGMQATEEEKLPLPLAS